MLHNLTNQHPVPDHMLHLLRHRPLHIIILLPLPRQNDIHARAQTRKDLGAETLLAQEHGRAIHLVEHDGRHRAQDLQLELGALDHVDRGDERIDDEGGADAVVQGDGVGFAVDADGGFGAAADEHGLIDRGGDVDDLRGRVEVLEDPFVAVEGFARRLLRAHALRFGFLAR